ncbi:quinol monooxygenase YgiN [Clostridium algifaecis]|uniref:Quinol monooxygenase YgiN n=1 Tax=Clostridium algifaecis TaxID=1472040 RepID=A0ABS4KVI1_9CLOT|nr:putative quinol monooxygenase [Clostridium algifaecis]MBP2034035.1 quinol monooxygenase YgiN [Clostridium algifaecis]
MIKVVARNFAQQDKLNEIIELYKELVELTRKEKGCIKYELYQDENNPSVLTMIEEWENKKALEDHFKAEHFVRIVPKVKKYMLKETDLNIYNKLI